MKKKCLFMILAAMVLTATVFTGCKKDEPTPDPVKVASVAFEATPSAALEIGDEFTFEVTVLPENAENKNVTWDSSDKTVATVSAGKITALAAGKTTISATAADGSGKKAEFEVTVDAAVAITGDGFDIAEPVSVKFSAIEDESATLKFNVEAKNGIENFLVDIDNPALDPMLAMAGLDGEFDLANPSAEQVGAFGMLAQMGLVLPFGADVNGKTELAVDITGALKSLVNFGESTTAFKLTVKDAEGKEDSQTLTLNIVDDFKVEITGDGTGEEPLRIFASQAGETPVVVAIDAPQGIENFMVKIDSSNETFNGALAGMGMGAEFDIANPGALGTVLTEVGLVNGDAVKGKSELAFDITKFIPMIFTVSGGNSMTADFTITVTDTKGTSVSETLKLDLVNDAQLTNTGFEDWSPVPYGTTAGNDIWYPSATLTEGDDLLTVSEYWDTANEGLSMLGPNNITMYDETDVRPGTTGKRSVKMQSTKFFGRFATGNIYTGDFGEITTSPLGANVYFGRPFTARPSALKGWYKANPGTVTDSSYPAKPVGAPDEYQIYIMLTDWTAPREVNTAISSTLINFEADYVIGLGQISDIDGLDPTKPVTEWTEFNIPIEYRSDKTPSYVVVVACASKYGDYLTGSTASVLQVDDFELVYE